jgi:hypothetical protein
MFDLLFIIFDSANLSLAFDTLFDVRWSCRSAASTADSGADLNVYAQLSFMISSNADLRVTKSIRTVGPICDRQRALAAFLFLALCAWISAFTVSVFR